MSTALVADIAATNPTEQKLAEGPAMDLTPYVGGGAEVHIADQMTELVKCRALARRDRMLAPGDTPKLLSESEAFAEGMRANKAFIGAIRSGFAAPEEVRKSLSPDFTSQFGAFFTSSALSPQAVWAQQLIAAVQELTGKTLSKSFTTTSPLASGLVPYNLVAPSRLIYPTFSMLRNKISRTPGKGINAQQKVFLGVSGSQTGGTAGAVLDIAIPELVQGGGSMGNWPLNIPPTGNQNAVDISVPYRFYGLSEAVSWLGQWASNGFEDLSALANLMLLQQFMMLEEFQMLGATSTALGAPSAPTVTVRTANSGETALSGTITDSKVDVKVTACNWWGETAPSAVAVASSVTSGTHVVDVQISPVAGAMWYRIYTTVGTTPGTYYLFADNVGGRNYTLQGAVPTSGTGITTADTGTYSALRYEGIVPVLAGHSQGSGQVYPASWNAGYKTQTVGDTLGISGLNTAFQQVYNGSGAFYADPVEIIGEGSDIMRLSDEIVTAGANNNYRLFIEQSAVNGVRAGAAVSEYVNPVTRSIVRILVHQRMPQGTLLGMTYQLPNSWSRVSQAWEMQCVQDYVSTSWPIIDATYRWSMFLYGAMIANAPQYSFIMQGLQRTNRSGSTGTWS